MPDEKDIAQTESMTSSRFLVPGIVMAIVLGLLIYWFEQPLGADDLDAKAKEQMAVKYCLESRDGWRAAQKIFPEPRYNRVGAWIATLYALRDYPLSYAQKERLLLKAKLLETKFWGEGHRYTLRTELELANLYYAIGYYKEARDLALKVLASKAIDPYDHSFQYAHNFLSFGYAMENNTEKKLEHLKEQSRLQRICHHAISNDLNGLDAEILKIYREEGRSKDAAEFAAEVAITSRQNEAQGQKHENLQRMIEWVEPQLDWYQLLNAWDSNELERKLKAESLLHPGDATEQFLLKVQNEIRESTFHPKNTYCRNNETVRFTLARNGKTSNVVILKPGDGPPLSQTEIEVIKSRFDEGFKFDPPPVEIKSPVVIEATFHSDTRTVTATIVSI